MHRWCARTAVRYGNASASSRDPRAGRGRVCRTRRDLAAQRADRRARGVHRRECAGDRHVQLRSDVQAVRRLLPIRHGRLVEAHHAADGPRAVGRLRRAGGAQPKRAPHDSRGRREGRRRTCRQRHPEAGLVLPGVHGHRHDRQRRHDAARAAVHRDRRGTRRPVARDRDRDAAAQPRRRWRAVLRSLLHQRYVATQLQTFGDDAAKAATEADAVIALETALAQATPKRADLRDPYKLYNPTPLAKLAALAPHVPWKSFFATYNPPAFASVNVTVPPYLTAYDEQLSATPVDTWKAYLRFHVADAYAGSLPKRFEDASFAFRSGVLLGVKEPLPRWQRCTGATDNALRDVLGKAYVAAAFPPSAKARAQELVDNLQGVLHDDIGTLAWMSAPTQARAREKLAAFTKKIGYPDKWEDFSTLQVGNVPFASNVLAVRRWNSARTIARIGRPTDRARWGMTPPTVNAYYNPSNNEIVFPAGILSPPFFNATADDAVNYGAIGAVIGHEMTHGFDDQARQYDPKGNLNDWWQPADAAAFKTKAQCIVDEYEAFEPAPGAHENGRLVQGEAVAALGGLTIAYKAFERPPQAKAHAMIDGYTPEQRFFLAYAQVWRSIATEGYIRQIAATNEHPWDKFRVLGTLSNMPEFQAAFTCAATDKMVRQNRCQIW